MGMHPLMTWSGRDPARRFHGKKRMSAIGTFRTSHLQEHTPGGKPKVASRASSGPRYVQAGPRRNARGDQLRSAAAFSQVCLADPLITDLRDTIDHHQRATIDASPASPPRNSSHLCRPKGSMRRQAGRRRGLSCRSVRPALLSCAFRTAGGTTFKVDLDR